MEMQFSNRVAVVTGAASGIGEAIARMFAERGARVVGVDRSEQIDSVCAALPGENHFGIRADLRDPQAAVEAAATVQRETGVVDILVNSAGIAVIKTALDTSAAEWQSIIDVNLSAAFHMSTAFGRLMVERGYGRIVSIASQAARVALHEHAAYCASKAGLLGLTRVLAVEWAAHGVTVNTVSPTIVETPMGASAWSGEKGARARAAIPVGRFAQPSEVADVVAFLASEQTAMITGEDIMIDGGYTIL